MNTITLGNLECLTTAPEDYDYGWTRTLVHYIATDDRGKVYRKVKVEDQWHFESQVARYGSGMNPTITSQQDLEQRIALGYLTPHSQPLTVHYLAYDLTPVVDELGDFKENFQNIMRNPPINLHEHKMQFVWDAPLPQIRFRVIGDSALQQITDLFQPVNLKQMTY
jgi:hypothetical protein